jgi:hypothetical protein
MAHNHSYISLSVTEPLAKTDLRRWFEIAQQIAPKGTIIGEPIMVDGHNTASMYHVDIKPNSSTYIIPLSRDLSEDEAGKLAIAWDRTWDTADFEIDFSQHEQSVLRKQTQTQRVLDEVAREAAKRQHNDWVTQRVNEGWSYGVRYNHQQKRHPLIRNWDQLNTKQQLQEVIRINKLFEFLESINLRLSRK